MNRTLWCVFTFSGFLMSDCGILCSWTVCHPVSLVDTFLCATNSNETLQVFGHKLEEYSPMMVPVIRIHPEWNESGSSLWRKSLITKVATSLLLGNVVTDAVRTKQTVRLEVESGIKMQAKSRASMCSNVFAHPTNESLRFTQNALLVFSSKLSENRANIQGTNASA